MRMMSRIEGFQIRETKTGEMRTRGGKPPAVWMDAEVSCKLHAKSLHAEPASCGWREMLAYRNCIERDYGVSMVDSRC
jgi:hypothetical protein